MSELMQILYYALLYNLRISRTPLIIDFIIIVVFFGDIEGEEGGAGEGGGGGSDEKGGAEVGWSFGWKNERYCFFF